MPQVFEFASTREAYNMSQTDPTIRDGDVLVVPSERAVGVLVEAWPTALRDDLKGEEFHVLADAVTWDAVPSVDGGTKDYLASAALAERELEGLTVAGRSGKIT
jgi:hypothetical protein